MARGNYYATAHVKRDNGKTYGVEVARQARTLKDAQTALNQSGERGYVQLWVASEHKRSIVAERDEAGNWWARNPYTGNLVAMD